MIAQVVMRMVLVVVDNDVYVDVEVYVDLFDVHFGDGVGIDAGNINCII